MIIATAEAPRPRVIIVDIASGHEYSDNDANYETNDTRGPGAGGDHDHGLHSGSSTPSRHLLISRLGPALYTEHRPLQAAQAGAQTTQTTQNIQTPDTIKRLEYGANLFYIFKIFELKQVLVNLIQLRLLS